MKPRKSHDIPKKDLKAKIKTDLETGFKLIRLHQEGKVKLKSGLELYLEL